MCKSQVSAGQNHTIKWVSKQAASNSLRVRARAEKRKPVRPSSLCKTMAMLILGFTMVQSALFTLERSARRRCRSLADANERNQCSKSSTGRCDQESGVEAIELCRH